MTALNKQALRENSESTIGILENIAGFEPSDIDGDTVELRFETEDGFDTGCDVSIVDQCQKSADVVQALLDELEAKDRRIAELEERTVTQPAPEKIAMQNFRASMEGIGHIRRTLDETFGGLRGTHCEPDVLVECKEICDAIYEAYRKTAPVTPDGCIPVSDHSMLPPLEYLDTVKFNADCAIQDPDSIYANEFFLSLDEVFGERGNYSEPVQAKAVSMLIAEVFRLRGYSRAAPQQEVK